MPRLAQLEDHERSEFGGLVVILRRVDRLASRQYRPVVALLISNVCAGRELKPAVIGTTPAVDRLRLRPPASAFANRELLHHLFFTPVNILLARINRRCRSGDVVFIGGTATSAEGNGEKNRTGGGAQSHNRPLFSRFDVLGKPHLLGFTMKTQQGRSMNASGTF